jgi:hypothetical protein
MSVMQGGLFRAVEVLFTAYAVPALIVPFVWLGRRAFAAARGRPLRESAATLNRAVKVYGGLAAVWLLAWAATRAGIPIEKGGPAVHALFWLAYILLNLVLAWLMVRFTAGYGEVPAGPAKDRLFLRFLSVVAVQPLTTACAFSVLFHIMGVVYDLRVPGLTAVQEGI